MPEWIWTIAVKKGIAKLVQTLLATYGATLAGVGITIDQQVLIAALVGLLEMLRNWLKVEKGIRWL